MVFTVIKRVVVIGCFLREWLKLDFPAKSEWCERARWDSEMRGF